MAKYILKNRGKGTYGLGEENISPTNLEPLAGNVLPTLDQILENNNTTIYPIVAKAAEGDDELATLGQIKEYISEYVLDKKDGLISGGVVTWSGAGFVYDVSSTVVSINGQILEIPASTVTLGPSDADDDRIDVVYVNAAGFGVVEGIPDVDPVEPALESPDEEFKLALIIVRAGTTQPQNIVTDLIYDENVEWAVSGFPSGRGVVDPINSTDPYTGLLDINVSDLEHPNYYVRFRSATHVVITDYQAVSFRIKLKAPLTATQSIRLRFHNEANLPVSDLPIASLQKSLVDEYQLVTVSLGAFTFIDISDIRSLRLYWMSGTGNADHPGFYLDLVQLYGDADITPEEPINSGNIVLTNDIFDYTDGDPIAFPLTKISITRPVVFVNGQYQSPELYTYANNTVTFDGDIVLEDEDQISIEYFTAGSTYSALETRVTTLEGEMDAVQQDLLELAEAIDDIPVYVHPTYTPIDEGLSGATVLAGFGTDAIGSVVGFATRTLTLGDLGYTPVSAGLGLSVDGDGNIQLGTTVGTNLAIDLNPGAIESISLDFVGDLTVFLSGDVGIIENTVARLGLFNGNVTLYNKNTNGYISIYDDGFQLNHTSGFLQASPSYFQMYHDDLGGVYWGGGQFQIISKDDVAGEYLNMVVHPNFYQTQHPFFSEQHNETASQTFYLNSKYGFVYQDDPLLTPVSFARFYDEVNQKGLEYPADYEANFTARSLITRQFLESAIGAIPSIGAGVGLSIDGSDDVQLGTLNGTDREVILPAGERLYFKHSVGPDYEDGRLNFILDYSNDFPSLIFQARVASGGDSNVYINDNSFNIGMSNSGEPGVTTNFHVGYDNFNVQTSKYAFIEALEYLYLRAFSGKSNLNLYEDYAELNYSNFDGTPYNGELYIYNGYLQLTSQNYRLELRDDSLGNHYATFQDSTYEKGLEYAGDYEANFTARSLITKQALDAAIGVIPTLGAGIGLSLDGSDIKLGDGETVNFYIDIDPTYEDRWFAITHTTTTEEVVTYPALISEFRNNTYSEDGYYEAYSGLRVKAPSDSFLTEDVRVSVETYNDGGNKTAGIFLIHRSATEGNTGITLELDNGESTLKVRDGASLKGLVYDANYSAVGTLDPRWIPDWGAVSGAITSGSYVHPTVTPVSQTLSGATVLASFASNSIGSVTGFTTRTLTPANIGAEATSAKGAANGYVPLNASTLIDPVYLPPIDYEDLINTPEFYFNSEDFDFNVGTSTLSKKGGPVPTTITTDINLVFDKDRVYGSMDTPLSADITESLSGANELTKAVVIYSNTTLTLDPIYKIEADSPTFDPTQVNVVTFEYYSDTFIGYNIKKFAFAPENLGNYSNKFDEYGTWQEVIPITRTQEVDDSWTLVFDPDADLLYPVAVDEGEQYYTFSVELKVVPTDFFLTIYANPGFTVMYIDEPIFPDTDGLTFIRVARSFLLPAAKTEIYIVLHTATGGTVEIQHAQLNRGVVPKPYIETTI